MNNPTITITSEAKSREIPTKSGPRTIHFQLASLETPQMRIQEEVEIDGPRAGYAVGTVLQWDVVADLTPGRFGVELKRRKTLLAAVAKPTAVAAR